MYSMTGFGRGEASAYGHTFSVEVKTVNHRYLDMNIRTPRFLVFLEEPIRNAIKDKLARGRVDVFVNYKDADQTVGELLVNLDMAKQYVNAANKISLHTEVKNDFSITPLLRMEGVIAYEEPQKNEDELKEVLLAALEEALNALIIGRGTEGDHMEQDLLQRKANLEDLLEEVSMREPVVVEEYKEKLKARLEEHLGRTDIDESRFEAEILYFADKASIAEEIVRIHSHLAELSDIIKKEEPVGRSLDFLVQELNREFNTIGSKASDITITRAVLNAKGEIEKIREQVQNIE